MSDEAAGEPVAPPVPATGDPRVDAALARLGELAGAPVAAHVEVFEDVHRRLQELLVSADHDDAAPADRDDAAPWRRAGARAREPADASRQRARAPRAGPVPGAGRPAHRGRPGQRRRSARGEGRHPGRHGRRRSWSPRPPTGPTTSRGARTSSLGALEAFGRRARRRGAALPGRRAPRPAASPTCCCARGAAHVLAVDVGYGQLAWSLRTDERVTVMDRVNVRDLTPEHGRRAARR